MRNTKSSTMKPKTSTLARIIAGALAVLPCAAPAAADDTAKVAALFANTEWVFRWWYTDSGHYTVRFSRDGKVSSPGADTVPKFAGAWETVGSRTVSLDGMTFELSADGKRLYHMGWNFFRILYRGTPFPAADRDINEALTKPGIVWVSQEGGPRTTLALARDGGARSNGPFGKRFGGTHENARWLQVFGGQVSVEIDATSEIARVPCFVIPDGQGGFILKTWNNKTFLPEPRQPDDPVPQLKVDRAKSPFNGTSWYRLDGKAALHTLVFSAKGTVSYSDFPTVSPEWFAYEDQTVRYSLRRMPFHFSLDAAKKRLIYEDAWTREVWLQGRSAPRLSLTETQKMKETLAAPGRVWRNGEREIVYTFDNKSGVSIDEATRPHISARWEPLCTDCIRIVDGKESQVFMIERDDDGAPVLERCESRLTLKARTLGE